MTSRTALRQQALNVAGVMSGTSADGIDVAIVRILPRGRRNRIQLLAHEAFPYPAALRKAVLATMDQGQDTPPSLTTAHFARLHARLGMAYAEAVAETCQRHSLAVDLVGCHGQTVFHQPAPCAFLSASVRSTLQIGDPAPIAEQLRVPVVSDFRPADLCAGGQGAPLVPLLDYEFFSHTRRTRVLQNLGGIGNLTLLPAGAGPEAALAFDTGPGNMVIDTLAQWLLHRPFDANGKSAARGTAVQSVVERLLHAPYFSAEPPKSCGREQFGAKYAERLLQLCGKHSGKADDALRTATLLTARSLAMAAERFLLPRLGAETGRAPGDYILSGGGTRNATLVSLIREELEPLGFKVALAEDFGMPSAAKEAIAFALLAWNTWHRLPGNLPSATGAFRPVVLGRISHV